MVGTPSKRAIEAEGPGSFFCLFKFLKLKAVGFSLPACWAMLFCCHAKNCLEVCLEQSVESLEVYFRTSWREQADLNCFPCLLLSCNFEVNKRSFCYYFVLGFLISKWVLEEVYSRKGRGGRHLGSKEVRGERNLLLGVGME